ncbi:MAG: putative selenium-dependent hydroxylase accessory protein YqeC [Deltaproteobacteria bacterium]|nr:putative selenium-dependent hydroxylase accessory protein YqeC [Deltaproteobacteria bacterium]
MTLEEAFALREREIISLIGGGGKTTLMFALGRELATRRKGVLLTTTTKIRNPEPSDEFALFLSARVEKVTEWIGENLDRYRYLLIAQDKLDNGKLQGIPPNWTFGLFSIPGVSCMIIEADGAAGRPLKAPREGEPVVAEETTLLIPMVGIDALGKPLQEDNVFRSRIAAEILKESEGTEIKEAMIGRLLAAALQNKPGDARVIPFINKIDLPGGLEKGRSLARTLLDSISPEIERVVLGRAREVPIVKEIIARSTSL